MHKFFIKHGRFGAMEIFMDGKKVKRHEPGSWSTLRDVFRPKPVECEA